MAFTTTQGLDNILLRNLTFRTTTNAAISSQYTLYANGQGQTYWSNSVSPTNHSSLSTAIAVSFSTLSGALSNAVEDLSTSISTLQSTVEFQSTQIYSTNVILQSSVSSLINNDQELSNSVAALNNQLNIVSNSLAVSVDAIYTSTIQWVNSTLYGYSSFSTFYVQIAAVQSSVNSGLSSLSTSFGRQNTSTYNTLTVNYLSTINYATTSSINYTNQQISSLSSVLALSIDLNTFSSIITQQLLSTSAGQFSTFTYVNGLVSSFLSTVFFSSVIPFVSTTQSYGLNLSTLNALSTSLYSTTNAWTASSISTSQGLQDIYTFAYINSVSSGLAKLAQSTTTLITDFSNFSTINYSVIDGILSTNTSQTSSIVGLQYEFSIITTSSILAGIYDSFIQLEAYTSTLIGSTIESVYIFESTLYQSTVAQNQSISQSYYNFFVSTLYASTLSTLLPSTVALTSSLVSSLYSTGTYYINSSLTSTTIALTNEFYASTTALTTAIVLSTGTQVNSSILGYVSTPMGQQFSTYSTLQFQAISSFNGTASNTFNSQSTLFGQTQSSFNAVYNSSLNLYLAQSTLYISSVTQYNSISTLGYGQLSTQSSLFTSSLLTYSTVLTNAMNSTNAAVYAATTSSATSTLNSIETSTLNAFNQYIANQNAQNSTLAFSSLYAFQNLTLTGTNYQATMDMIGYRNFTIRVYGLQSTPTTNYAINYLSNGISGLDYRKGIITLDISTVGSYYSNNNGQLRFDVYRWGLPTSIFGAIYPTVTNSDYILQYEYTILNQVIYTNLLNVYPRLSAKNPQIVPIVQNVAVGTGPNTFSFAFSSNIFLRGSQVGVSWSNYSFFPFGTLGAPPFNADILVDIVIGGSTMGTYGPYPLSVSSATFTTPYLTNQTNPFVSTTVLTYIAGNYANANSTAFTTLIPQFNQIQVYSARYPGAAPTYIGGTEIVGLTNAGYYPFTNTTITSPIFTPDAVYGPNNLFSGTLNKLGSNGTVPTAIVLGASNVSGQFSEASVTYPDFYVNLPNYFTYIGPIQSFGSPFTFTFSNATNLYSFSTTTLTPVSGNLYRIYNPGISKSGPTFTTAGQTSYIKYNFVLPNTLTSNSLYKPSTFLGPPFRTPSTTGPPQTTYAAFTSNSYSYTNDAISTITYYNVTSNTPISTLGTAIGQTSTAGMLITANLTVNGITYATRFSTSGAATDVFRF